MRAKRWIITTLTLTSVLYAASLAVNVIVDPFGVFQSNVLYLMRGFNERFAKIEVLKQKKEVYDSYMIGSSRIGGTEPEMLETYLPGSRFYNLAVSYGNLNDAHHFVSYLDDHDFTVKNLYVDIDLENMTSHIPNEPYYLMDHPEISHMNELLFYAKYLFTFSQGKINRKIIEHFSERKKGFYDLYETGVMHRLFQDSTMAEDPEKYIKNEPTFHQTNHPVRHIDPEDYRGVLKELKAIVRICDEKHINLILFFTPHNHHLMDRYSFEETYRFVKDIVHLHDLWFFAGYNSVTMNDHFYYEDSHYTYKVAELMAAEIFHDRSVDVPDDFGVLLTRDAIDNEAYFRSIFYRQGPAR